MPEFSSFFDETIEDPREYTADQFAEYFRRVLTNGIFNGGTNLKVEANDTDMTLNVQLGYGWIEGYMYKVYDVPLPLTIETADPTLDRIDRIVLRLDTSLEVRAINAKVLKGVPAASPVPPAIVRQDNIYDLAVAQVRVIGGKSFIEGFQITDERLNTSVCGLVNSLIQADTTEIFNQFLSWYNSKTAEFQQEWDDWFSAFTAQFEQDWTTWFNDVKTEWTTWFAAQQQEGYILESQRNQPGGFLGLNSQGKASLQQLPPLDYIPTSEKGVQGGVATFKQNIFNAEHYPVVPEKIFYNVSNIHLGDLSIRDLNRFQIVQGVSSSDNRSASGATYNSELKYQNTQMGSANYARSVAYNPYDQHLYYIRTYNYTNMYRINANTGAQLDGVASGLNEDYAYLVHWSMNTFYAINSSNGNDFTIGSYIHPATHGTQYTLSWLDGKPTSLARNGSYLYCVTDKNKWFKFTTSGALIASGEFASFLGCVIGIDFYNGIPYVTSMMGSPTSSYTSNGGYLWKALGMS